ncbi:MAG: serine/threonine protein kinase, partial [Cyanobacteria bacterium J06643_5]
MLEKENILKQRYKIKQKLAQNTGRQTWLAEDISIQPAETVILKFLSFGENFQWQDLKLFEREADILKQLSHPKIPKYRD